jgi:uncharacterized protein YgfB (UPF0149 family)
MAQFRSGGQWQQQNLLIGVGVAAAGEASVSAEEEELLDLHEVLRAEGVEAETASQ